MNEIFSILLILIASILGLSYFLIIWFDGAKFFIEYLKLFRLSNRIPHIKKYLELKESGMPENYLEYIETYKDNFLTRLVTCPKCFSFWGSLGNYLWTMFSIAIIFNIHLSLLLLLLAPLSVPACAFCGFYLYLKLK